ncbi:AraC family transcriptional regulator [Neolewinella agarilytica]|uniref:AraC family transcriptional regulator n=1 Tax=Neolewinella agarilytica TaxID=478744 RepID=UPI00235422DA|nr:AraC family transcriptional regulator [Neolewinella agarilytica]
MLQLVSENLRTRNLHTLVENRTTFTLDSAALNLFETHQQAEAVHLRFDAPVLASMIKGRKVMHLRQRPGFNFLPGESIMLPKNELMVIDFPDAQEGRPTKCFALEIDPHLISKVIEGMNERRPRSDGFNWGQADQNLHFTNDPGITQLIQRMVYLCAEDHPAKDIFFDMSLKELLIRLLEIESRQNHLLDPQGLATSQPITAAVSYILGHLDERLTIGSLSKMVYMSKSSFFRAFRNEMGISPVDFINSERIKMAVSLLKRSELSIRQVAMRCGFNSASYFTRMFKKYYGVSPAGFQEKAS